MLDNFLQIVPEVIFDAAEKLGGRCTGRYDQGQSIFEINEVMFTIFPKRPGRLEPELNTEQLRRLGRFMARLRNVG